jgi:recombinational DNA repair ATPase RecF
VIKLLALHIEEFRGIREIDLRFDGKSFVIHGPNGSGKSGVVDAIDFVLTGNIARLSGVGTKGVTVAKHGPHVHRRDDPASARVTLTFEDTDSGQTATLTRTIDKPDNAVIDPETPETRRAIELAQLHPELTLSRREIIKYIVSKPADRAQEVQALLKLDRLGEYRKLLKSMCGKITSDKKAADDELRTAENSFMGHLDISSLLATEIAREINARRKVLGLDELPEITIDTDFLQGMTVEKITRPYDLKTAQREVHQLQQQLDSFDDVDSKRSALRDVLGELTTQPDLLDALRHRNLVEQGLSSVQTNACPLCDREWDSEDELRQHLQAKLERSTAAQDLKRRITEAADEYRSSTGQLADLIQRIVPIAELEGDGELHHLMASWAEAIRGHAQQLRQFDTVITMYDILDTQPYAPPDHVREKFAQLAEVLSNKPDLSEADAARTFLTVAKDRWSRVRLARATQDKAEAAHTTAAFVYEQYCNVSDAALTSLYEAVETDFSSYYKKINADDEAGFKAALKPQTSSLDLSVDFYGLGMFPPTAYHSEGHQDGMGVCLYLALVKRLLGDDFSYAVLDDVVMSVDVNHRRQFCALLKEQFPDVQFIITTHDEVWARQMQSAGLITSKGQATFYGWTVDGGPIYEQGDVWKRIEADLERNDVPGAAHKLRRRLEAACSDIAHSIGGQVAYKADNTYDLSELINAVKSRHLRLLKKAADSANSWNDETAKAKVEKLKETRAEVIPEQDAESWVINPVVHNNDWANVSVADFRPTLDSTRAFLDLFTCENPNCGGWIYVLGQPEESLRCSCGSYNLNLKKK